MILVDIVVPSVDKIYDFMLDETVPIFIVIDEIVDMVCRKEQCSISGDKEKLMLCSLEGQTILDKKRTLKEYGIINGKRLILV